MSHFHRVPTGERLSANFLVLAGTSITVGLWSYLEGPGRELIVRSDNPRIAVSSGAVSGNSRLWTIAGTAGETARIQAVSAGGFAFDSFFVRFRFGGAAVPEISVGPLTPAAGSRPSLLMSMTLEDRNIIVPSTFAAGDPRNTPSFDVVSGLALRIGYFAARKGAEVRTVILLLPGSGTPDRTLVGITQSFSQDSAVFDAMGWSNPRSQALVRFITANYILDFFGPQVLAASRKRMALVLPVRAAGGHGELGPFRNDGDFLHQVLAGMAALTGGAFGIRTVEFFGYSSGVHDLIRVLASARGHLNVRAVYNIDPSSATSVSTPPGAIVKQYLSGVTSGGTPRPGFEFLPLRRWANEALYRNPQRTPETQYLHNYCMRKYCLHLVVRFIEFAMIL